MNRLLLGIVCICFGFYHVFLFEGQIWGINLLLLELPLLVLLFSFHPQLLKSKSHVWVLGLFLISLASVFFVHSVLAIAVHCCFVFILGGLTLQPNKNLFFMALSGVEKLAMFQLFPAKKESTKKVAAPVFVLRVSIIPLLIVIVFVILYSIAVPKFGNWVVKYIQLFPELSLTQIGLFVVGILLTAFVLHLRTKGIFSEQDQSEPLVLARRQHKTNKKFSVLGLKKEHLSGLILLGSLNALLAIINVLDITTYWFRYSPASYESMKMLVHEGTYILIFSILLSMGIALYYFRGNLNFYKQNKTLETLAVVWLAQNVLMVFSVAWRNYWYIADFNLAYKRIGVLFFLLATLFGIATIIYKIYTRKSIYYLFRLNANFALCLLLAVSFVNWDRLIVNYNLQHKNTAFVHKNFMVSLSPATLPTLNQHPDFFEVKLTKEKEYAYKKLVSTYGDSATFADVIAEKTQQFISQYEQRDWRSFNYADYSTYKALTEN